MRWLCPICEKEFSWYSEDSGPFDWFVFEIFDHFTKHFKGYKECEKE